MSYGLDGGELDLKPIQMACLSGGNGHGKSSLVDAMTWALWGKSRAPNVDDLLRQGTAEMEVELHFAAGNAVYRVIRKRALRKSGGTTVLELAVLDGGTFRAITGATIAETARGIEELLHLSYDTFSNSSLLLQGHADSFTVKPPSERKEVLAEILGLQQYEVLADRARERSRQLTREIETLNVRIEELDRWVASLPGLESALAEKEVQIGELQSRIDMADVLLASLNSQVQTLDGLRATIDTGAARIKEIDSDAESHARARSAAERRLTELDRLLEAAPALAAQLTELAAARQENDRFGELLASVGRLDKEIAGHRSALAAEESRLRSELLAAQRAVRVAEEAASALVARRVELEALRAKLDGLTSLRSDRAQLQQQDLEFADQLGKLQANNATISERRAELRKKLESLKAAGATCPVCDSPLDEEHREQLKQETTRDGVACKKAMDENLAEIGDLKGRQEATRARASQLDSQIQGLQLQTQRMGALEQQVRDLEAASATHPQLVAEESRLRATVESGDFLHDTRLALQTVEAAKAALGYDEACHVAVRRRIEALVPAEARYRGLERARDERREALSAIEAADAQCRALNAEGSRLLDSLAPMQEQILALPGLREQRHNASKALTELRTGLSAMVEDRGRLDNQITLGRQKQSERLAAEQLRVELTSQGWAHKELSTIFGKSGIQAMLIENALPELEYYANDLLARMTDNSTNVSFVTRRGTRTGSAIETLDIRIADNMGTRTYEMFSGGEAFRINLAIRIALSKLLTSRAGADLSFLLIDEGFGSQDALGRDRLVEAISAISGDFEKILVVTHIDELKDLFDVHIEVTKGPSGSQISVSAA